nr:PAS domain S-box protein [Nisaea sp.]
MYAPCALVIVFDVTEKKATDRDLADKSLELEAIFEHAPVMIGLKSLDGRWSKVNRYFARMLSRHPDDLTGMRSEDIWSAETSNRVRKHDDLILNSTASEKAVTATTSLAGDRSIFGTKFPVRNSNGDLAQIGFVGVDITDLTKIREEKELVSSWLREAQRIGNLAYWTWRPQPRELFWSDEMFRLLSWQSKEPPHRFSEYIDRIHPDDREAFHERSMRVNRGFRTTIEYRFTAGDGRQIWLYDEALPAASPDGIKFGFLHDITQRKEAEIRLRDSERRLSLAQRIAGIGIWKIDQRDKTINWSDAVYEIFGLSKETFEPTIANWFNIIHPDDHQTCRNVIEAAPAESRTYQIEYRAYHADGTLLTILEHGEHEYDSDGRRAWSHGTVQDITELKNLRDKAIEAQKLEATAALAGGLTHDFNNILGAIAGNLDVMEIRGAARLGFEPPIDRIRQAVRSGQALTQRLRNFARNEPLAPKPVSINRAVENIAHLAASSVNDRATIEVDTAPESLICDVDVSGLETALLNQILNSGEALEHGGAIRISASRAEKDSVPSNLPDGSYVVISIADDGPGMSREVAEHAFDAFFTTKRGSGGTGLGLYMIRNFVRSHGGEAVLHTAPGEGTRLYLFLPECPAERIAAGAPARNAGISSASGRILVVEDQPGIRAFMEDCLTDHGYEVHTAATGDEALKLLVKMGAELDAMICDVNLGTAIDGFSLARQSRALRQTFPIVFVSGFAGSMRALDAAEDFGATLIRKPFGANDLIAEVKNALNA